MKTYRVETKVGCRSIIQADAYVAGGADYRFLCSGYVIAQFPKSAVEEVVEIHTENRKSDCPSCNPEQ